MEDRGIIRNRDYAAQLRLFKGLRWGTITPTDIDGLIDFGDKAYVLIETKHDGAVMPFGQRLALERLRDIIASTGRPAVVVVASHNGDGDILVADCPVVEYRHGRKWAKPHTHITVRQLIDEFLKLHGVSR